jgi:hypothetical protein
MLLMRTAGSGSMRTFSSASSPRLQASASLRPSMWLSPNSVSGMDEFRQFRQSQLSLVARDVSLLILGTAIHAFWVAMLDRRRNTITSCDKCAKTGGKRQRGSKFLQSIWQKENSYSVGLVRVAQSPQDLYRLLQHDLHPKSSVHHDDQKGVFCSVPGRRTALSQTVSSPMTRGQVQQPCLRNRDSAHQAVSFLPPFWPPKITLAA